MHVDQVDIPGRGQGARQPALLDVLAGGVLRSGVRGDKHDVRARLPGLAGLAA
jgi:hypothetical protein